MMKQLNMKSAINRYNTLMFTLGYEYMTIGTEFSEGTEDFTLDDMVNECKYWLSTYYEGGHANSDMRYSDRMEERKIWKSHTGKLERFINTYSRFI